MNDVDRKNWIVTMKEGRNRQIRRTFSALGYTVTDLHRTNFGNYALGDIKPGQFEIINIQ
jgi:pseudouridine synthase